MQEEASSPNRTTPELWVVVSCMGRLAHLRLTAPPIIESGLARYCLVDFSCPDRSGAWLSSRYPEGVGEGRVLVVACPGERIFHKTRALNLGARAAIARGARRLCFADADTLFGAGALSGIVHRSVAGEFMIAAPAASGRSQASASGFLVVASEDFEQAGGYDEEFIGWGSEDIAMRLKLHLTVGLSAVELPAGSLQPIPHSHRLRTEFASERDLQRNALRNEALLRTLVERWTGRGLHELPASARALLFRP